MKIRSIIKLLFLTLSLNSLVFAESNDIYELLLRKRGCCSYHKGVSSRCTSTGRVVCKDGTVSPTCRCEPPRPKPTPKPSGGGSGSSSRNYSGAYTGKLNLTSNPCGLDIDRSFNTKAVVSDNGRSIRVTLPSGTTYNAQPQARQGFEFFITENLGTTKDGSICTQRSWLWWFDVTKTSAKFQYDATIRCTNTSGSCSAVWYGDLSRKL